MIVLNPYADFFLAADSKIQVRSIDFDKQNVRVHMISDNRVQRLIRTIGTRKSHFQDLEDLELFFKDDLSDKDMGKTAAYLLETGFLTELDYSRATYSQPWQCHAVSGHLYWLRIDHQVYLINSASRDLAEAICTKIARRYDQPQDRMIHVLFRKGDIDVFGATRFDHDWVSSELARHKNQIQNHLVSEFIIRRRNNFPILEPNVVFPDAAKLSGQPGYWQDVIKKATTSPGIISRLEKSNIETPSFITPQYLYQSRHILTDYKWHDPHWQSGMDYTENAACGKAIMESYERYCCGVKPGDTFEAKAIDLKKDSYIHPETMAAYLPEQLDVASAIKNFSAWDKLSWTSAHTHDGNIKFVPSCFCSYSYVTSDYADARSLFWANTSGVSSHFSFEAAALNAIRELIERDAVMLWWINRISPPFIPFEHLDKHQQSNLKSIGNQGYEVKLLRLTLDLLPVILCVARMKDDQWPYFFCSAACHEDETLAIDKTVDQVLCLTAIGFEQKKSRIRPQHVTTPGDHRKFYLDPRNKNHLNFLFSGTPAYEPLVRIKNLSLEEICQTLTDKGMTPFFKNLTCEELKDENPQVCVVRAMIPGLIPITFGYMQEPLALPRVRCLFIQLNLRNQPLSEQKFMAGYQVHMFA